ncbi:MAG: FUSC family protein [Desulfobaccales bacterium]
MTSIKPSALRRADLRVALQMALVCLAAYLAGFYFTHLFHGASAAIGGLWSVISGGAVLQATRRDTWTSASLQILATFIGAVASAVYLSFLPFNPFGMAAVIGVVMLLCQVLGIPDHARLASIAVAVIMVFSTLHLASGPLLNASLRFIESVIGTALAVVAVLLWSKPD